MGLELALVIFGLIFSVFAIITSSFLGKLSFNFYVELRQSLTNTFGRRWWIMLYTRFPIWIGAKFPIWLIRICGIGIFLGCLFFLVWFYILGN